MAFPWPESLSLSRREFLAQLAKGSATAMLTTCTPLTLWPSSVQAEATPTQSTDELLYASAAALAKAIREKKVSSEEVVSAYLRRIEEVNPKLNAIVQLTAEVARAQARDADAALARGEIKGPLHGVPFTVKDTIETAGVTCTSGTKGRASFVPTQDATAVTRLRAAGAILLGKTNTSELGLGFETDNVVYGRTNNPYDVSRTPGGSSGGEAALIAAGGSPLGLCSANISQPAHFCGIAGLSPTPTHVPRTGHFPPPTGPGADIFQVGLMARFVEDLSLTLPIVAGIDGRDPAIVSMSFSDPKTITLKGLRVAVYSENEIMSPTPETVATVRAAAKTLSDAGAIVEEARPPRVEESYERFTMAFIVSAAMEGSAARH
jgi:amidase